MGQCFYPQVTTVMMRSLGVVRYAASTTAMKMKISAEEAVLTSLVVPNQAPSSGNCLTLGGIEIDPRLLSRFAESFQAFKVDVAIVTVESATSAPTAAITACLLPLRASAVASLGRCGWFSQRRTLLYAIGNRHRATEFHELGINALLETTTDLSFRAAISSTRSVIARGIGECARVPMVIPVSIEAEGSVIKGLTSNVGDGGMALRLARSFSLPNQVTLRFALPGLGSVLLNASPRWYSGLLVGLRFEPSNNETALKRWVRQYSLLGCPS